MSRPYLHKSAQFAELNKINNAMWKLQRQVGGELTDAYRQLGRAKYTALRKLGLIQPRTTTLLKLLVGLSPGEIKLFMDAELGWLVVATPQPGARPVRRYVSDDIALNIINGELTHELEAELMAPVEEYIA